ncbi:MAG: hypothetical protein FJ368_06180 [Pelagibacterales bacterium]|nr:hypothetical protein [Pelagibacterales bacterium]
MNSEFLKKNKIFSISLIFILNFFCTNSIAQNYKSSFVVAKVNNKVITNSEIIDRYNLVLFTSKINVSSSQEKKNLLNQIVDKMVDEELIRQESENLKITVTDSEIADAIEVVALHQKKNAVQFKLALLKQNISFSNYAKQIESELLWSKIISEFLRSKVRINDSETKEFLEQKNVDINVKRLFIAEVFIPFGENAKLLADKLVIELRNGADFKNIVKQFSHDSLAAQNHGEIGWVSQKDIDPKIYAEVSKLQKGEYSNAISLSDGYYIFKLIESKFETKIDEQDLKMAQNNIFMRKLQNIAKGYLMDMRKKSFVEIDRKYLENL